MDIIYNPVVSKGVEGEWPNVHAYYTPMLCMHCEKAPCVLCCPAGASKKDDDGIVWVDPNKCMGCKVCAQSCPYGARSMNHKEGYIRKCTFCKDRVREGEMPYCVNTCHQKARIFGDLDDPNSEVSKLVGSLRTERLLTELGTEPQVYYIPDLGGQG
ncbi:MAG: 4Fe-4S dicluster domain-containing protein [Coriobacteriales bacterium]|nr:4Fe-4S dicluster domain-containing protein [Coriobacteriales bacterium]